MKGTSRPCAAAIVVVALPITYAWLLASVNATCCRIPTLTAGRRSGAFLELRAMRDRESERETSHSAKWDILQTIRRRLRFVKLYFRHRLLNDSVCLGRFLRTNKAFFCGPFSKFPNETILDPQKGLQVSLPESRLRRTPRIGYFRTAFRRSLRIGRRPYLSHCKQPDRRYRCGISHDVSLVPFA